MSIATALILACEPQRRFQNGFNASAPFPLPTKTTAPVSRSRTNVRYLWPLPTEISSMAIRTKCFNLGLPNRLERSRLTMSLIRSHVQVLGDVLDGHEAGQFQCVMFKGLGIAPALIRKANPDLSDQTAGLAMDARNLEVNDHGFASDGEGSKRSLGSTTWVYCRRAARRATQRFFPLVDGKVDGSSNEGCPSVDVSPNPERMVQQAGGHAVSPI